MESDLMLQRLFTAEAFETFLPFMQNLPEGVKKVSAFFNLPLTDEQVSSIAGESTFSAMVENAQKSHGNFGNIFFRKGKRWISDQNDSDVSPYIAQEQRIEIGKCVQMTADIIRSYENAMRKL